MGANMPKKRINDKVTQIPPTNNDNENICDSNTQSIIEPQENITEILAKPTKTEISDSDKQANTVSISEDERETAKLQAFSFQQDINQITHTLGQHQFSTAIALIDNFIKNHQAIVIYNDIDLVALKLEIRQLEHQLNAYDNEKIELEKLLSEFNYRHTKELGSYISRLLHLRKLSCENDPETYAEAVQDEAEYHEQIEIENAKTIFELDDEQRKDLKKAYRKASQICHPDRVSEDMKDIAEQLFIHLNQAYEQNDIATVNKILAELEQGIFAPRSETVSEKSQLQSIITQLKFKIAQIETEIFEIKDSEAYQTISEINDWDGYFEQTKEQLTNEIVRLEQKLKEAKPFFGFFKS